MLRATWEKPERVKKTEIVIMNSNLGIELKHERANGKDQQHGNEREKRIEIE